MKVSQLISSHYEILTQDSLDIEFKGCYATDLLSAAIKSSKSSNILITIISHVNTVATAMMVDLPVIIITESKTIDQQMIDKANEEGIAIISTPLKTYEVIIDLHSRNII
ncbi:MAG: hypothetical protein JXC31_03235 [Acholeplasmataceae bacterium]|nr:hypothetical protein [Acholeplasmataceae bacterium]